MHKICTKCKNSLELSCFYKDKGNKDGYNYWCKHCVNSYNKNWRIQNPEKYKLSKKKYSQSEKGRKVARRYQKKRRRTIEHKIWWKAYMKTDKYKFMTKNGRVKRKGIIHDFTYEDLIKKLDSTNGICPKCGKFVGKDKLVLDHIIPINSVPIGTIYTIDDVQTICLSCNSKKGDKIIINSKTLNNIFKDKSYEEYIKEAKLLLKE